MAGRVFAAICIAAVVASCENSDEKLPNVELTEVASGQTIGLTVGQGVTVTLEANPTTGYSWTFECAPAGVLTAIGDTAYVPDKPIVPGSGRSMQYKFSAVRQGEASVRFEYRRAWDAGVPAAKTVSYSLVVR